jgi:hypothetical protein
MRSSPEALGLLRWGREPELRFHGSDGLLGGVERAKGALLVDVRRGFGQACVYNASLARRVFVIGGGESGRVDGRS